MLLSQIFNRVKVTLKEIKTVLMSGEIIEVFIIIYHILTK